MELDAGSGSDIEARLSQEEGVPPAGEAEIGRRCDVLTSSEREGTC